MRKARELTGLDQRDFADLIGVSRQSVTNAEKDHVAVRRITLNAWAMATGVPVEWLNSGTGGSSGPTPPSGPTGPQPNTLGSTRRRGRNGDTRTTHEYVPAA